MSYTDSESTTYSYTEIDVENVVRRFTADIVMMAQSSGAITEDKARQYAHDVEALAKKGYLSEVDLTLFSGNAEVRAAKYTVDTRSGHLKMSRPGGVMWPRVLEPYFRIVLFYTDNYTPSAREAMRGKLLIGWSPTDDDTSHALLSQTGGRDYASNAFGMQRKDFAA